MLRVFPYHRFQLASLVQIAYILDHDRAKHGLKQDHEMGKKLE